MLFLAQDTLFPGQEGEEEGRARGKQVGEIEGKGVGEKRQRGGRRKGERGRKERWQERGRGCFQIRKLIPCRSTTINGYGTIYS